MDVNYLGSVLLTRAVVPSLVRQKQGRVVFVSSMAGQLGLFGYTAYSPSKFALRGLAESLQMEVRAAKTVMCLQCSWETIAVLLLGCGNAEILLNIFISCINGKLACLSIRSKWEWPAFFMRPFLLVFLSMLHPGMICMTFCDWPAAHRSTNHCNCLGKRCHLLWLLEWTWSGQYEADFAWFQLHFHKK